MNTAESHAVVSRPIWLAQRRALLDREKALTRLQDEIARFRQRMGWKFTWVSSNGSDFNSDFHVSFTPEQMASGKVDYNYVSQAFPQEEAPGVSAFVRNDRDEVFHTYSTYGRGVEVMMGAYSLMDLTAKGRDEDALRYTMEWVRHHDRYEASPTASCCGSKA